MNVEELKLVLEMVGTVSGDAKTIAIVWMSIGMAKSLLFAGVVLGIAKIVVNSVIATKLSRSALVRINRGLGNPGSTYPAYEHEFDAIVEAALRSGAKK